MRVEARFINELGNTIRVAVIMRAGACLIEMAGPTSESTNEITMQEARALRGLLNMLELGI